MYVYILESINFENKFYIGKTTNLKKRITYHNQSKNTSTVKYKPWKVIWCCWFETPELADNFEKYLKTGSGFAFRNKHLVVTKTKADPLIHNAHF